jgi:hypothetical protein
MRESRGSKNIKQFNHRACIREGFVFEKYMNMCADPENNASFNSGPLNKPVFYVYGTILLFYVIIVYKSILNHCMKLTVIILLFGSS